MSVKIDLVVIDPQNSFCKIVPQDQQQVLHDGELCVSGAWDDMLRVAELVNKVGDKLNDIHITLDSHHKIHIAHPIWFRDSKGNHPSPFTLMEVQNGRIVGIQIDSSGNPHEVGEYLCSVSSQTRWTIDYLNALKSGGKYPHCIWPYHCLIGTAGHNVVAPLMDALLAWEERQLAQVSKITKGSNFRVEHFSAIQAEVVDASDPTTQINSDFINTLMNADEILFAGEAGSHCLANTVRDIANAFKDDSFVQKCVLLEDGTSPVPGFEHYQDKFIQEMKARGMRVSKTTDYITKLS